MMYLYVFLGGGIGSLCRFGLSQVLPRIGHGFPWATLAANVLASAVLAVALLFYDTKDLPNSFKALVMIGFCGGFSTFSTFGMELFDLWRNGQSLHAILYATSSLLLSLALFYLLATKWN